MDFRLPVNMNIPAFIRGWEAARLPAILANKANYSWFFDKFNDIYMNMNFLVNSYYFLDGFEKIRIYDDVVNYKRITDFNGNNLIQVIKAHIDNGYYVIVVIDHFYIPGNIDYNKKHRVLDALVFGYDAENLILVDIYMNDLSRGETKIGNSEFSLGFFAAYNQMKDRENEYILIQYGPLTAFSVKTYNQEPNLINFYYQVKKNLTGSEIFLDKNHCLLRFKDNNVERRGITVYSGYYEALPAIIKNREIFDGTDKDQERYAAISWGVKSLYLIKSILSDKLSFINEQKPGQIALELINRNNEICNRILICFNLLTKYAVSLNDKHLSQFCAYFREIEVLDRVLLSDICKSVYSIILEKYFAYNHPG